MKTNHQAHHQSTNSNYLQRLSSPLNQFGQQEGAQGYGGESSYGNRSPTFAQFHSPKNYIAGGSGMTNLSFQRQNHQNSSFNRNFDLS